VKFSVAFYRQNLRFLFLILCLLCTFYAFTDSEKQIMRLKEGESAFVPGTQTKIVIQSVIDSTSSGCLGGPIGCRDRVTIEIHSGNKSEEVVLQLAKTDAQKERKIDQTSKHGKTIHLAKVNKKEVELVFEESVKEDKNH
jgi:hypothetical protein